MSWSVKRTGCCYPPCAASRREWPQGCGTAVVATIRNPTSGQGACYGASYPEEAHAPAWRERAHAYLMNGVSVEADARDATRIAGRSISDWHVGANFFSNYALDHHGYLNKDLHLVIPNDLFNSSRRDVWSAQGKMLLNSPPARDEVLELPGPWLNIDDRLGVVALHGGEHFRVDRSASRRAGRYRSLFVEEICLQVRTDVERCLPGTVLVDVGFAVLSGVTAAATAGVRGGALTDLAEGVRGVWVVGADGGRYALVANFGNTEQTVDVFGESVTLAGGTASVRGPRAGREEEST